MKPSASIVVPPASTAPPDNDSLPPLLPVAFLFQAGVPFPQRMRNGLFLGKFIQRIKTPSTAKKTLSMPKRIQSAPSMLSQSK